MAWFLSRKRNAFGRYKKKRGEERNFVGKWRCWYRRKGPNEQAIKMKIRLAFEFDVNELNPMKRANQLYDIFIKFKVKIW